MDNSKDQTDLKEVESKIDAILKEYNCGLQPVIVLTDGNVAARINVLKLSKEIPVKDETSESK